MSNGIGTFFQQSELALAAYAMDLFPGITGQPFVDALKDAGMSPTQAARFARDWRVVVQYNHSEPVELQDEFGNGTGSFTSWSNGLSATVFEEVGTGRRVLAIRGTENGPDYATDFVDVFLRGSPQRQSQYQSLLAQIALWQTGSQPVLGPTFTVTGHSLGGFLAGALTAEHPEWIDHAFLYNAPGVRDGNWPAAPEQKVSNIRAESGISPIAALWRDWGAVRLVTIENQLAGDVTDAPFGAWNHSQRVLVDALAVYDLFVRLDAGLASLDEAGTLARLNPIFAAASARTSTTLESLVAALHKLLTGEAVMIAAADRDVLYATVNTVRNLLDAGPQPQRTVVSLVTLSADELHTAAANPDALATRYALRELNPFAVLGLDYSRFNQNGELDLFDPATGTGTLTQSWLEDRAKMLVWLIAGNTSDRAYGLLTQGPNWQFQDLSTGQAAYALATANAIGSAQNAGADPGRLAAIFQQELALGRGSRVVFGSAAGEIINGGRLTDRLYGGGGNDVLNGDAGSDYLEGDAGDDVLIGGGGNDIYAIGGGIGTDIIVDAAEGAEGRQLGEIRFGDAAVAGTFAALDADLKSFTLTLADGQYYASYTGSVQGNLAGTLTLWRGDSGARVVQIQNFRSGDLGIVLGTATPLRIYSDIVGTQEDDNTELGLPTPHRWTLFATAESQKVFGLGGSDAIVLAYADTIGYGGSGNDIVSDVGGIGAVSQQFYGEDGDDCLVAGAGNDELYGGLGNDVMQGGADNDLLAGEDGDDFLDGGVGADVLIGGAGADFILGGGNLSLDLRTHHTIDLLATGTYPGLGFNENQVTLPLLIGVDPWRRAA